MLICFYTEDGIMRCNLLKIWRWRLARGLRVEAALEGQPVIVVILAAAVLVVFVVSLLGSFATSQRRRS